MSKIALELISIFRLLVEDINFVGRFSAASDGHSDVFACVVASSVDLNSRGGVVGGGSQWKKAQIYGIFLV